MKRISILCAATAIVVGTILPFLAVGQSSKKPTGSQQSAERSSSWYAGDSEDFPGAEYDDAELPPTSPESKPKRTIHLNYIRAPWERVLKDLATSTDSMLVVHDAPRGYFSRTDFRKYTPDEAIRILNDSLREQQCRILKKGKFLTVITSQTTRPKYARREFGRETGNTHERLEAMVDRATTPQRNVRTISHEIARTGNSLGEKEFKTVSRTQRAISTSNAPRPIDLSRKFSYSVVNQTATSIAKQMHNHWLGRSKLINAGPEGLPAFEVYSQPTKGQGEQSSVLLTAGIDTEGNRLVVEANEKTGREFLKLANMLDRLEGGRSVKLLEANPTRLEVATRVKGMLPVLRRSRFRVAQNDAAAGSAEAYDPQVQKNQLAPATNDNATNDETATEPKVKPSIDDPKSLPSLLETLKGDVTVEGLNDLNLLILRGNEGDVEAVMRVIRAIEAMAEGSTPEIHLLKLRAVSSEGLAVLLNDVYEKLSTLRATNTQPVRLVNIIPVVTPNAILILAPETTMPSVLELAEELDQPVDPAAEVEVFFLKSAVASDAAELLDNFYEEREGLGQRVKVTPDLRTNSLVVQARPRDLTEVAHLIEKIDRDHSRAVGRLKVIPLKHAIAEDLAEFLTNIIAGLSTPAGQQGAGFAGNQGNQQGLDTPKSMVLEFMSKRETTEKLLRSGILSDARISAETRSNSLAVSAPPASIKFLEELIAVLDQPTPTVADIKIFTLQNADAAAAVELLEALFADEQEEQIGVQLAGAEDASSGLVPLRFSVDGRTNSVIAKGGPDALRIVEAILLRLDESDERERKISVIKLRNTPASDIANSINQFLEAQRALAEIDPTRTSASELLNQEVIVTPEPISNNLVISATPKYFDRIVNIANELDRQPAQVIIQALLVEVELNDTDEFGIELGYQDSVLFDRGIVENLVTVTETLTQGQIQTTSERIVSQEITPGFNFNNQPLGTNGVSPSTIGSQSLSNFGLGRVNGDLGFGGLVLSAGSERVNVLIRALASRRDVRILSRPQILALDNQTAQIQVGQVVPVVDGVTLTAQGVANPNVRQDEAGIILTVTPRISPEGMIVMETVAEKSAFNGEGVPIFVDAVNGNVVESPIKDITTAVTTVAVPDGQTIVVGGMITKTDDTLERKVPLLGDIPLIGQAFRYDSFSTQRTELLIFLTPRIIHNESDSELIKQIETERMQFFVEEAEEVHGPLFGVPAEQMMYQSPGHILPGESIDSVMNREPVPSGSTNRTINVDAAVSNASAIGLSGADKPIQLQDSSIPARNVSVRKQAMKPEPPKKSPKSVTWNPRKWFRKNNSK